MSRVTLSSRIPQITAAMPGRARAVVAKTILDVEAGAKDRSRVDTGAMKNAWQSRMTGDTEGEIANGVEHAVHNEFGTVHMSAQPMLIPAVEQARPGFEAACKKLIE